jgi:hypothetical protein
LRQPCHRSRFYGDEPSHEAAAMFTSLCALAVAIEKAETLNTSAVATQLRSLVLPEFFDNISFDANGMVASLTQVTFNMPAGPSEPVRAASINASTLIYPMPPWPQRWCEYIGPETTYADYTGTPASGPQCSGHGTCNKDGTCDCETGYDGTRCEQPGLQAYVSVESYGHRYEGDGTIHIAGPLSLDTADLWGSTGQAMKRGALLFLDLVRNRSGVRVGTNRNLGVWITFLGDGSARSGVESVTRYILNNIRPDFVTGPYTSELTLAASQMTEAAGALMISAGAGSVSVISSSNLTFGVITPANLTLHSTLSMLASKINATELLREAPVGRTVGFVQADRLYAREMCSGGPTIAKQNGLVVPISSIPTIPVNASDSETMAALRAALQPLKNASILTSSWRVSSVRVPRPF